MRKLLILLLFPFTVNSQQIDTIIFRFANGNIKYLLVRNQSPGSSTDSILVSKGNNRAFVSQMDLPVSTPQAASIATKSSIYVGTDAGSNDSYVITASPVPAAYTAGMVVIFKANTQNTTGCNINVNSLGVKTIVKRVSTTPATADILALMWCTLVYDGANFVIQNPVVN